MNSFSTSKQFFRLEWLGEAGLILPDRLIRHFGEKVRRLGEQIVPKPFGFELGEDPGSDGIRSVSGSLVGSLSACWSTFPIPGF
ncbi:MAG TPA: hypothetical protein VF883_19090 [Thermoanaerobaculia bacterium]|jgi:hypothetical protein